jgi:hypothetical protein
MLNRKRNRNRCDFRYSHTYHESYNDEHDQKVIQLKLKFKVLDTLPYELLIGREDIIKYNLWCQIYQQTQGDSSENDLLMLITMEDTTESKSDETGTTLKDQVIETPGCREEEMEQRRLSTNGRPYRSQYHKGMITYDDGGVQSHKLKIVPRQYGNDDSSLKPVGDSTDLSKCGDSVLE